MRAWRFWAWGGDRGGRGRSQLTAANRYRAAPAIGHDDVMVDDAGSGIHARRLLPGEVPPPRPPLPPRRDRRAEPGEFPGFERALAIVVGDVARTWAELGEPPSLHLIVVPSVTGDSEVHVAEGADSKWHGNPVPVKEYLEGDRESDPVALVADLAQETIIERVLELSSVWPVCAHHGFGLHVRGVRGGELDAEVRDWPLPGPGVWWCGGDGGHVVAAVGSLGRGVER
jgi:hypothetical protein